MARILCTVTNDLSYDQRMIRICSTLAGAGYTVQLVGRRRPSSIPLKSRSFDQKRLACFFQSGKLFYLEYNLRLLLYLLAARADVLCAVDLDTLLPAYLVSRLRGLPLVYDAHEYFTEVPELAHRPGTKRIWEALAHVLLPRLKHAYTVGEELAAELSNRYGTSFEVIRNVPFRRSPDTAEPPLQPPVLLYQGALNRGRGLEEAILAMHELPDARLWLAGEGDLSEALRALARREGLAQRVRFLGYVQPEDLWKITPQATLGLNLLADQGLNYYYSLANKVFDYIQAGIPSLNPDFPEYRKLQATYGCLVLLPRLDPPALAGAVRALLKDMPAYRELRKACQQAAGELHWEKESEKLLSIYSRLLRP
jgi:glycosyltransferase involved in cell wall biosynthesis